MASAKPVKGWFTTRGRPGDRTLGDQMKGLYPLFKECRGKTIFDVGSAEGLISIELAKQGAAAVHGIEVVPEHVDVANKLRGDLPCTFEVADAQTYIPKRRYHIVIMLAVLHKLRWPDEACTRFADAAEDMVVLRLPPEHAPKIIDERSHWQPHDMGAVLRNARFMLSEQSNDGHFGEWVGVYRRIK